MAGCRVFRRTKKTETVETTASSLVDGLKKYAAPDNLASILGIGKSVGGQASSASMASNLESTVISALTSKVGLNPSVAGKIASTVIPAVISLFKNKVNDSNEPGFNLESLAGGLAGKMSGGSGSGVMGMLGGLFGKKG